MNLSRFSLSIKNLAYTFLFGIGTLAFTGQATAEYKISLPLDSIGTEVYQDHIYIIHKIQPKETYYQLSRIYSSSVNEIMAANNKKNLRVGDTVRIPTDRKETRTLVETPPQTATNTDFVQPQPILRTPVLPDVLTDYKVGKKETLFAISKRFGISVGDLKEFNSLTSDSLQEGQLLQIPVEPLPEPEPEIAIIIDTENTVDLSDYQTNRYGVREKKERGIGVWMENLTSDGKSNLALHKTAPIGTILKITNPMTKNVTYAKVVGKFSENADTQDAIVVLSKSAAAYIGALDRRFQIELTYGLPLEF